MFMCIGVNVRVCVGGGGVFHGCAYVYMLGGVCVWVCVCVCVVVYRKLFLVWVCVCVFGGGGV